MLMGNNASYKIVCIRLVRNKMFAGIVRMLSNVRHVPDLKQNLISLSTLMQRIQVHLRMGGRGGRGMKIFFVGCTMAIVHV